MKDFLKGAAWTFVGLGFFSGMASERARGAAKRDLERAIPGARFQVTVLPRGFLGHVTGDLDSAQVQGSGFTINELPFTIEPAGGIHARLAMFELKLRDITVRSLPLQSLEASIPKLRVDAARILFNGHFTIRSASEGYGEAIITEQGLRQFIARKRPEYSALKVTLTPGLALVTGQATLLLAPTEIEARVKLGIVGGRFLNAVDAEVKLGGQPVPPVLKDTLLRSLNPIIDVDRDVGLGNWLYATSVEVEQGALRVFARVSIPFKTVRAPEKP